MKDWIRRLTAMSSAPFWILRLFGGCFTTRRSRRKIGLSRVPYRWAPRCEVLEDRLTPAQINVSTTDNVVDVNPATITIAGLANLATNPNGQISLREAILAANNTNGPDTIELQQGAAYDFARADVDNFWYGPNALPAISSPITVQGHGATLNRTDTGTTTADALRFFYVSGGLSGLAAGSLTLKNLTLQNGLAKGGDSMQGGGMGVGGAIFAQGNVTLEGVTLRGNQAVG